MNDKDDNCAIDCGRREEAESEIKKEYESRYIFLDYNPGMGEIMYSLRRLSSDEEKREYLNKGKIEVDKKFFEYLIDKSNKFYPHGTSDKCGNFFEERLDVKSMEVRIFINNRWAEELTEQEKIKVRRLLDKGIWTNNMFGG